MRQERLHHAEDGHPALVDEVELGEAELGQLVSVLVEAMSEDGHAHGHVAEVQLLQGRRQAAQELAGEAEGEFLSGCGEEVQGGQLRHCGDASG